MDLNALMTKVRSNPDLIKKVGIGVGVAAGIAVAALVAKNYFFEEDSGYTDPYFEVTNGGVEISDSSE